MRFVFAALILPFSLAACNLASFNVPLKGTATVEAGEEPGTKSPGEDLHFEKLTNIDITTTEQFKSSGMVIDDVKSIELTSVKIKSTDGEPLDVIDDTIEVFVSAENLPDAKIASGKVAPGDTKVSLDTFEIGLKKYAKTKMTIWAKIDRKSPEKDREIEFKAVLHVEL